MPKQTKKLKLLVTGASGLIGYEVSRQPSRDGYRTRLMIRQPGDDREICRFVYSLSLLVCSGRASLVSADTQVNPVLDYGRIKVDTEKRLSALTAFLLTTQLR